MKISFIDFWGDFDPEKNLITDICKNSLENIVVTSPQNCDVLFCGQFGNNHQNFSGVKKIFNELEAWYKPNFNLFDYSIGFDSDIKDDRYFRMSAWVWNVDWFHSKYYYDTFLIPLESLTRESNNLNGRNKFASFVFSNAAIDRLSIINFFSNYKNIDVYGPHGIYLPRGVENKLKIISDYKFNFCWENSSVNGYFTEKLIHAKSANCVPIYKSSLDFDIDFNKNCCIQVEGMSNEEILELVKEYDNNDVMYKKIQSEPLFYNVPDINKYINGLLKFL